MTLDERTTIGVVDLRTCLQAVAQCSPEIVNQPETDYSIYATDYSEPDWPLVGQGVLSWGLDHSNDQQQLVTGRVTRNIMALLGNGSRDTLEVKLKLTAFARSQQQQPRAEFSALDALSMAKFAATPTETASEWNSFVQSNPVLAHSGNVASMPSPALPPAQLIQPNNPNSHNSMTEQRFIEPRHESLPPQLIRPASIPPQNPPPQTSIAPANIAPNGPRMSSPVIASQPVEVTNGKSIQPMQPARPSRPSSRSRNRQPTGRPRGRPRKKPVETGNTSAAEEATDGDEGPQKKRAKVTQAEYSTAAPFGAAPDSLRVHASISGSLRNMRPVGSAGDTPAGANHLQDVPRAPTPVPDVPLLHKQQQRMRTLENKVKPEPIIESEGQPGYRRRPSQQSMRGINQDALSPTDSVAQSPDQGYSPEDSPVDLGSSPPVPRTTPYIPSSPMASSPILPAMPMRQVDSGFMSGLDDLFDEDELLQELPTTKTQKTSNRGAGLSVPAPSLPPHKKQKTGGATRNKPPEKYQNFPFQEVNPGPPELLPTTSIFKPSGKVKTLNRPPAPVIPKKSSFQRSNTAPSVLPGPNPPPQDQSASQLPLILPHDGYRHSPLPSGQGDEQSRCSENIEDALQHALAGELGHHVNGSKRLQPDPVSMAEMQMVPVPERPQPSEHEWTNPVPERPEPILPGTGMMPVPERPEPSGPELTLPTQPTSRPPSRPNSRPTSRPTSRGPTAPPALPLPDSDPAPEQTLTFPQPFMSEAPTPLDEEPPRYSKNQVKKQSIKERLETAIQKGESPPFCCNCGAIETPTWRKIWTQEHQGVPEFHEFSDKPGCVTTIDILERDTEGQPSTYRLIKKHLGPTEDKKRWTESVLCNPCGIWLAKFKGHRPPDRWEKDAARLGQPRRKRENKNGNGKGKKARTKSDVAMNPTSEAYFTTDPLGPADVESPKEKSYENGSFLVGRNGAAAMEEETSQHYQSKCLNLRSSPRHCGPGSTHSRGSGTADSPIAIEDDLGTTRRLLFPSPRKDGVPKVLGELCLKHVQTNVNFKESKSAAAGKENAQARPERPGTPVDGDRRDLDQELFGTPPNRPSTPPSKSMSSGVFKTPTRPTPSHRPITRSISRSIRSVAKSPGQVFGHLLRTPSKTPRSSGPAHLPVSTGKRRSPRHAQLHAHFALEDMHFDSPFTATLNQLLSEANEFTAGSPSHGLVDLDLAGLPNLPTELDSDTVAAHLNGTSHIDFGNFLSTDLVMPSSPPLLRGHGGNLNFGLDLWTQIDKGVGMEMEGVEAQR